MTHFFHILFGAIWLGTAATLPFWGNRMNRADHLHTVLGIVDTIFILKCVFIMGGLLSTLATGSALATTYGFSISALDGNPMWINLSLFISLVIFINSWVIFFFLLLGRRGRRSLMRMVPPIGYTNIGLIVLVVYLMAVKPGAGDALSHVAFVVFAIVLANAINITVKLLRHIKIKDMQAKEFADMYFGLLNAEKMTDLLKLFSDGAKFYDPFATKPVLGILAIEQFFQKLGDQFDSIKIVPRRVTGDKNRIEIEWEASGTTQNGESMDTLVGTNIMQRKNGKIFQVDIDFNLGDLPTIQRVAVEG